MYLQLGHAVNGFHDDALDQGRLIGCSEEVWDANGTVPGSGEAEAQPPALEEQRMEGGRKGWETDAEEGVESREGRKGKERRRLSRC